MRSVLGGVSLAVCLLVLAVPAHAATLYFDPYQSEIYPGDTVSVAVRVDTDEGECINVVDAVITYDPTIVPVDVSRGQSITPIWVEEPTIDTENHQITFASGIPNGYCGRIAGDPRLSNIVLELLFQAPAFTIKTVESENTDIATIAFTDATQVLLNDGTGTPAPLTTLAAEIYKHAKPRSEPVDEWLQRVLQDTIPPNKFSVTLDSNASIYAGRYYVTFNTTDKQSGIDHYEIMEEPIDDFDLFAWGGVDAPWREARSPYLLKDQSLNSTIRVKAVDKAGNEYVAVYVPEEDMRGASDRDLAGWGLIVAGLLLIGAAIAAVVWYRIRLRRYETTFPDET